MKIALGFIIGMAVMMGLFAVVVFSRRAQDLLRRAIREWIGAAMPPIEAAIDRIVRKQTMNLKSAAVDGVEEVRDAAYEKTVERLANDYSEVYDDTSGRTMDRVSNYADGAVEQYRNWIPGLPSW